MSENPEPNPGPLTGWEVTAPQTDTVLRQFLLAQAAFQRLAGRCHDATVVETDRFLAVDTGRPATMMNFVLLKQPLLGPEIEETMQEIEAIFGMSGARGFAALYTPLPTPDLAPYGWTLAGHPPLQLRSPYTPPRDTSAVRVERVTTEAQMTTFEQIIIEGFEMSEMQGSAPGALLPATMFDDPGFRAYLAFIDGTAVSAAASVIEAGINLISAVATLPAGRRKGAATAVTQAATQPELGLATVLFSSDEGRPVYERLGFVPILRGSFWYRTR